MSLRKVSLKFHGSQFLIPYVNECNNIPCRNNGDCINSLGSYICVCTNGWTGPDCSIDIMECATDPCFNGGVCLERSGSFHCICPAGWEGNLCTDDVNECDSVPCNHNGGCVNSPGSYSCVCTSGWTGQNCSTDVNECNNIPCRNNGDCINSLGSYICVCTNGWTGPDCSIDIMECATDPCFNGGVCLERSGSFHCSCPAGWEGNLCTDDVNECDSVPCNHNGGCVNSPGSYSCVCTSGWTGQNCSTDVNECNNIPCRNNGDCINSLGSYICVCTNGWTGPDCSIDIMECATDPCFNGGVCLERSGSFHCSCPAGWEGNLCTDDVNECDSVPCNHNGGCVNSPGSYSCVCTSGWTGQNCSTDVNECNNIPCRNNGDCINSLGSYICVCTNGWTGPDCSIDIMECATDPCFNGGVCLERSGSFHCSCPAGWEGNLCTDDVNECDSVPCNHNGGCVNSPGSYSCVCTSGWTGQNCSTDVNECDSFPCGPGSCQNTDGSFTCDCPVGRTGPTCGQVLRTTFVFYLPVLNRTFTAELSNETSQGFISLSTSFCNEVKTILQGNQQQFQHFFDCKVANYRNNPFIMNVELTFDGNETISTLQAARTELLDDKPSLYSGRFGVTIGDLVVEVQNYNATRKTWHAHLVNMGFTPDLLDQESASYRTVDSSLCSDISHLMTTASPYAQNYIGCIVENIQNATNISSSSLATLAIYMEGGFNIASLQDSLSDFLSTKRPLVRFGDYMGHNLGEYIVYFTNYAGYIDVPLTLQVLNQMWTSDLANPQSNAHRQLATPFCTAVTALILANSTLGDNFKECMDVQFGETPSIVNVSLRFDSANMTYDVRNMDFYTYIKEGTLQDVFFDYYSRILGPLLVFHPSWGTIAFNAVLIDTEFEFYDINYVPGHSDPNSTVFRDFQLLFCKDIDAFISATTALKDRYYGCIIQPISDTSPHNFTLRIVFNGTDDVTQQDIITAISNSAGTSRFGDKVIWEIGRELVYLAENAMGQPVNMSDYTTPAPQGIVFTEFIVTFQALNLTYTSALDDRTSVEFSSLAVPLLNELNTLYQGKQDMEDYISSIILRFRENPDEVEVSMIFDGPQISTLETKIYDVLLEYSRRASGSGQPAFMIGTLLLDQINVTVRRSTTTMANTTTSQTTVSTTTATTTTSTTTTTPAPTTPGATCCAM
ncbi:uncharacterized protein LOC117342636 [Pecten maximus]|uniref:uncharacterized protein LOC117342636 n=1 Tax=Pecten maximus TaxID=6579 RepID=UPI0014585761|nr:uncharacterized protein LOC117342636 [Pecten maximus]